MKRSHIFNTGERISPDKSDNTGCSEFLFNRLLFAYAYVKKNIKKGSLVLDLGSGEGYGANYLSDSHLVVGVDASKSSIKKSQKKYSNKNCFFLPCEGGKLPFKEDVFDIVVSVHVIEHIKEEKKFVSEIHRILSPGGLFFVHTPNRILRLRPGQRPWNRFHVREYDALDLKRALSTCFAEIDVYGITGRQEIFEYEENRLSQIKKISALDPFYLHRFMPEWLRYLVVENIKKLYGKNRAVPVRSRFSIEDFFVVNETMRSLDLLAVCRK
jgi:SAM-dependent methyltransferase